MKQLLINSRLDENLNFVSELHLEQKQQTLITQVTELREKPLEHKETPLCFLNSPPLKQAHN